MNTNTTQTKDNRIVYRRPRLYVLVRLAGPLKAMIINELTDMREFDEESAILAGEAVNALWPRFKAA